MMWPGEEAKTRSLVRKVEVSNIWVIVVFVSEFSAWLVLGSE